MGLSSIRLRMDSAGLVVEALGSVAPGAVHEELASRFRRNQPKKSEKSICRGQDGSSGLLLTSGISHAQRRSRPGGLSGSRFRRDGHQERKRVDGQGHKINRFDHRIRPRIFP